MAKQSIKKFTAILLAVILAFSVFTLVPITASAVTVSSDNIMGDVDGDGVISIADATTIQKYVTFMVDLDYEQLAVADTNGDRNVDIRDATQIQRYLVQFIPSLG
ncbi:MAG: dockerin type I repeat-containing protein [Oscillospiraceae bacterium]|nr:dockerin type I repeat-containing protein [Oscillospiraceae bacterium]